MKTVLQLSQIARLQRNKLTTYLPLSAESLSIFSSSLFSCFDYS